MINNSNANFNTAIPAPQLMPIRLAISGVSGRMGQSLLTLLAESPDLQLTLPLVAAQFPDLGKTLREAQLAAMDLVLCADLTPDFDVLIDFSTPENTLDNVAFCRQHHKAMVIGTTGLSESARQIIQVASAQIPILLSDNMSLGVNLLARLCQLAAEALYPTADIEICETHHKHKVDAPSGTAMMLGRAMAEVLDIDLTTQAVFAREGLVGARQTGQIGFSTLRGGDVVGEHTVSYFLAGERLELTHRASDRSIFARGALTAARFIQGQKAGLYSMQDVLGLTT